MGLAGEQRVPLAGATIALKGRSTVVAGDGGHFTVTELPNDNQLVVSFIGYQSQTITLVAGKTEYTIVLEEEHSEMDEVFVTGYQVLNRESYNRSEEHTSEPQS